MKIVIGTAGWSIPAKDRDAFASEGPALSRYASRFAGVEINSSFHRPHRRSTWERWASETPGDFGFAAKLPKTITHGRKLVACEDLVPPFLDEVRGLGSKLALLLVQLPPSLSLDAKLAEAFFALLAGTEARIACEPRHPSWFEPEADALFARCRVGADPARVPAAATPGGWREHAYLRLHGSPLMYRSSYDGERLEAYAALIADEAARADALWCMFDNTASSAATSDALRLMEILR